MRSVGKLEGCKFLNPKEASDIMRVAINTLANWRVMGKGPRFHKFGGHVRYSEADIKEWAETHKFANTQEGGAL